MNLVEQFGINWQLLIAQVVNFLIVFYLLKRYMYKPVLDMLKKRQQTIKTGLADAEEARLKLEQAAEKEREILKKAQLEAKKLLDDTRAQQKQMLAESEAATKKQAEAILKDARSQIAFETAEAEHRLTAHISELAVSFLQKSISELFTEGDQELIMKNALKKLKGKSN